MIEKWRPIPGYANYEVSTFGRVRSVDHVDSLGRFRKGQILRQVSDGKGNYLYVSMMSPLGAKRESIHRAVASAFIPNPEGYNEINHIDEDKKNNAVWNLEWCSRSYNNAYGGHLNGERNHQAKLKEHEARYIKEHPEEGTTALAKKFGISLAQTSAIIHGTRWGWL